MYKIKYHSKLELEAIHKKALSLCDIDEGLAGVQRLNGFMFVYKDRITFSRDELTYYENKNKEISVDDFLDLETLEPEIKFSDGIWRVNNRLRVLKDTYVYSNEIGAGLRADTKEEAEDLAKYLRLHAALWQLSNQLGEGDWFMVTYNNDVVQLNKLSALVRGFSTREAAEKALKFLKDNDYL